MLFRLLNVALVCVVTASLAIPAHGEGNGVPARPRLDALNELSKMSEDALSTDSGDVEVWLTTPQSDQGIKKLRHEPDIRFGPVEPTNSPVVLVDEANQGGQLIEGFGAAMTDSASYNISFLSKAEQLRLMAGLFGRTNNEAGNESIGQSATTFGLNIIRLPMGASDFARPPEYTYDDNGPDPDLSRFTIDRDREYTIPLLQLADEISGGSLKLIATPWTAPPWMKYPATFRGGWLMNQYYDLYADYFVRFIRAYEAPENNLSIGYVTIQNEPESMNVNLPAMRMSSDEQAAFVPILGDKLASAGLDTKILIWDHNLPGDKRAESSYPFRVYSKLAPDHKKYVYGVAWHCYELPEGDNPYGSVFQDLQRVLRPGIKHYLTECTAHRGEYKEYPENDLTWALTLGLIGPLRAGASSVTYWNLALDETSGPTVGGCKNCNGLVFINKKDSTFKYEIELFAIGHFSKFVKPGARRIGSSTLSGQLETVAFKNTDSDGSIVLVVASHPDSANSVTFRVRWSGREFQYTLPPKSVVTFKWRGLTPPTAPPTTGDCNASSPGITVFTGKNFTGSCAHLSQSHPNLGLLQVGDNTVSSIIINGSYRVNLCRDINYGRPCEEMGSSQPDLDIRSIGGQFSSIEIMRHDDCDDERAPGVFLYSERDYSESGACTHATNDIVDLGTVAVGDNQVSSVRINGEYKVKLYKDANFGGGYEEINRSEPNLDDRSLGGQYSSVRLEQRVKCENTTSPGVYLYSEKRFKGSCYYMTGDVSDLGATPVGDNGVRSLRIVGPYKVNLYKDRNFGSPSDEYSKDQEDLTWRSLGDQYSSAKLRLRNQPPVLSLDQAGGAAVTQNNQVIWSNQTSWTFAGAASDSDGTVTAVDFNCSGDSCNQTRVPVAGTANWSHAVEGLVGKNRVYFHATDDGGARSGDGDKHAVEINVDLAPPDTTLSFDGDASPGNWPQWFTAPVTVRLSAADGGTGQATAGVAELHYQLDGGGWQSAAGSEAGFGVAGDGSHTLEYYAVDRVGNAEALQTRTFAIDQTPPGAPANVREAQGVCNGVWQRNTNVPSFAWDPAADAVSGVWGYQFYFDQDPAGVSYQSFLSAGPLAWTPFPAGTRTGSYYLRGRTRDMAGNFSPWTDFCTFRFDGAPPENPEAAAHAAGIASNTWQTATASAAFTWPPAYDEGSGIAGYQVYWGVDAEGAADTLTTGTTFQSGPLCAQGQACTGYLRLRSTDNVGNLAGDWTTAFVLRYDTAPPTLDFGFSGSVTQTAQSLLTLDIAAADAGSGVAAMRLSHDGRSWTDWEPFAAKRLWRIPSISRQWWPVYVQVRDALGWESQVVSRTVYLDVNVSRPRSANYRLFDYNLPAGGQAASSSPSGYQAQSTIGQGVDGGSAASANYSLSGGYQAGSRAVPLVQPAHDEFNHVNGVLASSVVSAAMLSGSYRMLATVGEFGLPNNVTTLGSQGYRYQPGFLAAQPSPPVLDTVVVPPEPKPEPTPQPPAACAFPSIAIAGGAAFTNQPDVTLSLCAPKAVEMMVSSSEAFTDTAWEPYAPAKAWTLESAGQQVLPRLVYALFRDADGAVHGAYIDDIIYDPNPPTGGVLAGDSVPGASAQGRLAARGLGGSQSSAQEGAEPLMILAADAGGAVDMYVAARDDNSRLAAMQFSESPDFAGADWETYSALKPWQPTVGDGLKTVYARFRDGAGNVSAASDASFVLDSEAPEGAVYLYPEVVGPDNSAITLFLDVEDSLTGVSDVRISTQPDFAGAAWEPYFGDVLWPVTAGAAPEVVTIYVQYRDYAGNVSPVYSAAYVTDVTAPEIYAEVDAGETLTRTVHLFAYDEDSVPQVMRVSESADLLDTAIWQPLLNDFTWQFDEDQTGWVQVADSAGNASASAAFYAEVPAAPAVPRFAAAPTSGPAPLTVQFTDQTSGTVGVWLWDFGDGSVANEQSPSHQYTVAGAYGVTMTVNGPGGVVTYTQPAFITVSAVADISSIALAGGWNFISLPREPVNPALAQLLLPLNGAVDRVFGDGAYYSTAVPPQYNTLAELHSGAGYYLRLAGAPAANLDVGGERPPAGAPVPLKAGWNMVGYLPESALPVATALQSIAGKHGLVLSLDEVYDPAQPQFSTLAALEPGRGYLIWMNEAADLIYPATADGATAPAVAAGGCTVSPTPQFSLAYGAIRIGGQPAPAGSLVQAINGAGQVVGCHVVRTPGLYGYMHIYGIQEPGDVGMQPGEIVRWRVNGVETTASAELMWQNDLSGHQLDLDAAPGEQETTPAQQVYLPFIGRD